MERPAKNHAPTNSAGRSDQDWGWVTNFTSWLYHAAPDCTQSSPVEYYMPEYCQCPWWSCWLITLFCLIVVSSLSSISKLVDLINWNTNMHILSIILIAVFRVCVSMCLSVISEISGTGHCSATLFRPSWRASPGELRQLLLELTEHLDGKEKPLEPFRR